MVSVDSSSHGRLLSLVSLPLNQPGRPCGAQGAAFASKSQRFSDVRHHLGAQRRGVGGMPRCEA